MTERIFTDAAKDETARAQQMQNDRLMRKISAAAKDGATGKPFSQTVMVVAALVSVFMAIKAMRKRK